MTDKEYIRRYRKTREECRRAQIGRNFTILGLVLLLLVAVIVLLGSGRSAEEVEQPEHTPVAITKAPTPTPTPVPTPAPTPAPAAHYPTTDDERSLVERVVAAESANQTLEGQMAVAQCILNTAVIRDMRPDEVVLEPNQYADPASPDEVTDSVREAVSKVFDRGERVTDEPIRFFYAPKYSKGSWHESALEYVLTIGGHRFFKERGT